MSITSASGTPTPRKVSSASSSPLSTRVGRPTPSRNSTPFTASRTALVPTASARSAPSPAIVAPVVGEARRHALDGGREEAAGRVDALAEVRDPRLPVELDEVAVDDVGDEEPGRARAQVDRGDARHLRGKKNVSRPSVDSTSSSAPVSTASRRREAASRASAASSFAVRPSTAAADRSSLAVACESAASLVLSSPLRRFESLKVAQPRRPVRTPVTTTATIETASEIQTRGMSQDCNKAL